MVVRAGQRGFTLIELMMVVAILGILAAVGMSGYQTYSVRAQVSEGITLARLATQRVVEASISKGEAPANRTEAGLSADPTDTSAAYVESVDIENGRIGITYGNRASALIAGRILYLTPYETPEGTVVWRCGNAPAPQGAGGELDRLSASGGGNSPSWAPTSVDTRYLPANCR